MKIALAKCWSAKGASRSPASFHSFHKCLPCLPSRWVSLGVLYPIMLMMVLLTFRLTNGKKMYDFIILSWSKQWVILLAVISKSYLWWFWIAATEKGWNWENYLLTTGFMCFLELRGGGGGGGGGGEGGGMVGGWVVEMTCTCLGGFCLEVQIRKNGVTIERRISS